MAARMRATVGTTGAVSRSMSRGRSSGQGRWLGREKSIDDDPRDHPGPEFMDARRAGSPSDTIKQSDAPRFAKGY
jgi:hypothetical protein